MKIIGGSLVVGAGFGAATSLINAVSSPYSLGAPLTDTVWMSAAKVLSLLMDAGWAWAALAVVVGRSAGTRARGAVAGVLALVAATAAYYATDSFARDEPFAWYGGEMLMWWAASVLFGSALGAVGAAVGRPGVIGLLAGLTVPVGAAVQMIILPPGSRITSISESDLAVAIVWTAAVAGAIWAVHRFWTAKSETVTGR
ncbi:hypothetical protein GQS52_18920 [Streptomyces sp. SCUT-3]|uniref:hypothetical protein n=1 Tax=Streptomyces sp. SCUT-3 TaxID=2684469 RepID=UPI000CB910CF|nr:hypothetical protein [Streptomyces sp. SCUT-3]PLW71470.1 hypothetical protein C0036_17640 [Streptomyces sp. DJ]QMV23502.1 hypothetical protein GQS52_18920 [Streptomyces sp. SCUT-3]